MIVAVAGFVALAAAGATAAGGGGGGERREVSQEQYDILINQCRYAGIGPAKCRAAVKQHYRVGAIDKTLDCRVYSGVAVCGKLRLSKAERRCVRESVAKGLSSRRAEVECYSEV
ncbi:hypothetical protein SAMN05421874_105100 [Nonomuraea maritima]|uniref:Uncharacterized protein n=1 Tax=Nonomuraea maritima TaxID=683260 RepID=A0A1G8Z379_9ACTN|nr:hypothetical protein [Nonomuraea maritima]SDK09453.1 hypothetical protein SAMN05421874_105100 [Nonomuraea maritima]